MIRTILIIGFSLIILNARAQSNPSLASRSVKKYRKEWANFGVGVSSGKVLNGITAPNLGVDYHWLPNRITYQAGFSGTNKIGGGVSFNVLNAGVGKSITTKSFLVSLIAGPGLMWGNKYGGDNGYITHFERIGIVANAEIILKTIKNLGIGFEMFANVNEVQSSFGFRIVIHLNNDK